MPTAKTHTTISNLEPKSNQKKKIKSITPVLPLTDSLAVRDTNSKVKKGTDTLVPEGPDSGVKINSNAGASTLPVPEIKGIGRFFKPYLPWVDFPQTLTDDPVIPAVSSSRRKGGQKLSGKPKEPGISEPKNGGGRIVGLVNLTCGT